MQEIILSIVAIGLILLLVIPCLMCAYDLKFGTSYSCRTWGWHNGKGNKGVQTFDGCSVHATCSKCGKEVMQDSQGKWF